MQKKFIIIIGLVLLTSPLFSAITLPALVGDNMVLQQNSKVNIWGKAQPGEQLTVTPDWNQQAVSTIAGTDSLWNVVLKTPAAGGPYSITLEGENTIVINNVLLGEVWLCSGQSNMEKPIGEQAGQQPVFNHEQEIATANHPHIRLFKVPRSNSLHPQIDVSANWEACSSHSVDSLRFSAAAYFFGRSLHQELGIPIGLIDASWGGTRIEPWTPVEGFKMLPSLDSIYQLVQQPLKVEKHAPTLLFNGMIAPLTNFTIKGCIWYQGESNLMDVNNGLAYEDRMKALIYGWRNAWNNDEMPFYYVQIAPYRYFKDRSERVNSPDELPLLWEAQTRCLQIPNTGMVVTTDLVDDLSDIHPRNKLDVGKRLALHALAKDYKQKNLVYSGPQFKKLKIKKNKVILSFEYSKSGLMAKNGDSLTWFTVAGSNRNFVPARAVVKNNKVLVSSPEVENPVAVRFAWHEEARPNFFNGAGLPAVPFRTDNWPMNKN